jgi:hypothetical protein
MRDGSRFSHRPSLCTDGAGLAEPASPCRALEVMTMHRATLLGTLVFVTGAIPAHAATKGKCFDQAARLYGTISCESPEALVANVAVYCPAFRVTAQDRRDIALAIRQWQKYRAECSRH